MSYTNNLDLHSRHLRVEGNEEEGYRVIYYGKVVKYTKNFDYAMDIAIALLVEDWETLWDHGLNPQEVFADA